MLLSPLSTYLILLATYEGSDAKTKTELEDVLYLNNNLTASDLYTFSQSFSSHKDKSNRLNITNPMSKTQHFQVNKSYKNLIFILYKTSIESINFSQKRHALNIINNWVSEHTNQNIKNIISSQDINKKAN